MTVIDAHAAILAIREAYARYRPIADKAGLCAGLRRVLRPGSAIQTLDFRL